MVAGQLTVACGGSNKMDEGETAGRIWALRIADAKGLGALGRLRELETPDAYGKSSYTVSIMVFFRMFPDNFGDRYAAGQFWKEISGTACPQTAFVSGFVK